MIALLTTKRNTLWLREEMCRRQNEVLRGQEGRRRQQVLRRLVVDKLMARNSATCVTWRKRRLRGPWVCVWFHEIFLLEVGEFLFFPNYPLPAF